LKILHCFFLCSLISSSFTFTLFSSLISLTLLSHYLLKIFHSIFNGSISYEASICLFKISFLRAGIAFIHDIAAVDLIFLDIILFSHFLDDNKESLSYFENKTGNYISIDELFKLFTLVKGIIHSTGGNFYQLEKAEGKINKNNERYIKQAQKEINNYVLSLHLMFILIYQQIFQDLLSMTYISNCIFIISK
jgi:hypothetical protein